MKRPRFIPCNWRQRVNDFIIVCAFISVLWVVFIYDSSYWKVSVSYEWCTTYIDSCNWSYEECFSEDNDCKKIFVYSQSWWTIAQTIFWFIPQAIFNEIILWK